MQVCIPLTEGLDFINLVEDEQNALTTTCREQDIIVEMLICRKSSIIAFYHPEDEIQ